MITGFRHNQISHWRDTLRPGSKSISAVETKMATSRCYLVPGGAECVKYKEIPSSKNQQNQSAPLGNTTSSSEKPKKVSFYSEVSIFI